MTPLARRRRLFRKVRTLKLGGCPLDEAYKILRRDGVPASEADEITVKVYRGDPEIVIP